MKNSKHKPSSTIKSAFQTLKSAQGKHVKDMTKQEVYIAAIELGLRNDLYSLAKLRQQVADKLLDKSLKEFRERKRLQAIIPFIEIEGEEGLRDSAPKSTKKERKQ